MLSSTTRPTEIARPPRVMKFRFMPFRPISTIPVKMLSGIDSPMTIVGLRLSSIPRARVGRREMRNANTTTTANMKPRIASRCSVSTCLCIAGPSLLIRTISTPGGRPDTSSSASITADVTSTVLASGSLTMFNPRLGFPFVLDMLVGMPPVSVTSATSERSTGKAAGSPGRPESPTTRFLISSTEP